jgi:hypothetical protein
MALGRENQDLHAHLARLTVLYEDLRLELLASAEDEMKVLDGNGINYRKQYFMRRAIATTVEFAEAFRLLNARTDFQSLIRSQFSSAHEIEWRECVSYLADHEREIERIRNDVGGHFGYTAALAVIRNLKPGTTGMIRTVINSQRRKGRWFYEFAGEIAAAAAMRHKPEGETEQAFFSRTLAVVGECFKKAIRTTDLLTYYYTHDRFA